MQSSIDLILSKITYNEILRDEIFDYGALSGYKDAIIQLSDGSLVLCFSLLTAASNLCIESDIERRDIVSKFFANLDDNWQITFELRRIKDKFEYIADIDELTGSVREIESRRKREFTSSDNLINMTYLILVHKNIDKRYSVTCQGLQEFANKADELKNTMAAADCDVKLLRDTELIRFLKYAHDFSSPEIKNFDIRENLSKSIINAEYKFKNIPLVINYDKNIYTQCFSPCALPSFTYADMFCFISSLPFEIRCVFKYKNYSKEKSKSLINHKKKSYKNSIFSLTSYMKKEMTSADISDEYDHEALDGKNQCDAALGLISQGEMTSGDTQITFILHSCDLDELEDISNDFKSSMQKNGFLIKQEKLGNSLCFLSSLPASDYFYNPFFLLSKNFCDFLHLGSPSSGAKESKLLISRTGSKAPLIYAKNLDGSVFYFSPAGKKGEKGHSFITGPTGSGKSALLSLMASSFLKYKNTRCIIIDRDLSALEVVCDNTGKIFYPGFDSTCFQPLYNAKGRKAEVFEFIRSICFISNLQWNSEIQETVDEAIEYLENKAETMSMLYSIIKGMNSQSQILPCLLPFIAGGEHGGLFDSDKDGFDIENRLTLIETNKIFKNSIEEKNAAIPFFIYLFSRLDELFNDCKPTLLIIDEGWKILKNSTFSHFIEEWLKTLRKKNVDIVLSCTNLSDISQSQIAETVISNTQTQIFFKDANAQNEIQRENYKKIGVSENILNLIKNAPDFCPVILQEDQCSIVDFRMQNILGFIITSNAKKKKLLCEE